ncbi:ELYS protein, partial [Anhinga anhinga]|nr:ELYS protein [Anhinga anhinga]
LTSGIFGLQGNESQLPFPFNSSPRAAEPPAITHPAPDAELCDAFVGTPLTKFAQKCPRSWNVVVCPVPSHSAARAGSWPLPRTASASFVASSPLKSNRQGSNLSGASELNLLGTPHVVKVYGARMRIDFCNALLKLTLVKLAMFSICLPFFFFFALTKGISVLVIVNSFFFKKEKVTEDDRALAGASPHHRGVVEDAWCESRDKPALFTVSNPEADRAKMEESLESVPGGSLEKMDVSKGNSNFSARSEQATLEYRDAK